MTGHGSQIAATHRRSIERFDFDSVLLPYSYVSMRLPYYAENFEALLATCGQRQVAVQTIKSLALRPWLGRPRTRSTWYEPLQDQDDIDLAVWWVLGRPELFLDSVGDVELLPRMSAASRFAVLPEEAAMRQLLEAPPAGAAVRLSRCRGCGHSAAPPLMVRYLPPGVARPVRCR